MVDCIAKLGKLGAVALLLLMHIVGTQTGQQITLVAVHVDERLEAVLFAAVEEPVNWAFLIGFQVVGVEVIQEVATDYLTGRPLAAEGIGNKFEVIFQCVLAIDLADEVYEAPHDVIIEILIIADGDNVVWVRDNGFVLAGDPFAARIGKSVNIQRVAPEHTAHGIRD